MSWTGVAALVLGVLFTAYRGSEWLTQAVVTRATPAGGEIPAASCPAGELVEEGLSVAECEQLVAAVQSRLVSAPGWFPAWMAWIAAAGAVLGIVSLVVGGGLLGYWSWAPVVATTASSAES